MFSGDEIIAVDNVSVVNSSHHQVVGLMGQAAQNGRVTLTVQRRIYQPQGMLFIFDREFQHHGPRSFLQNDLRDIYSSLRNRRRAGNKLGLENLAKRINVGP